MKKTTIFILSIGLLLFSCTESVKKITVNNSLNIDRSNETVKVTMSQLVIVNNAEFEALRVMDDATGEVLLSQKIDSNGDGKVDIIIFQPNVKANSKSVYKFIPVETKKIESKVFSRFVPERIDDYAWENDKVAFRTFGPEGQRIVKAGESGGAYTSGIDCWLKRVDYPILNKWYKAAVDSPNYYHTDHGEGLDAYHVGSSRGCGGIGAYIQEELFVSENFTTHKTMANGPVRTCFTLDYNNWNAGDKDVKEQKHISLDLGNNLMRIIDKIEGVDTISVGLTLHEKEGKINIDTTNYCFSYWEPLSDSEQGVGIVVPSEYYLGFTKIISEEHDKSQLLVHLKVINGKVKYYTGFGWKKSGQFANQNEWNSYLQQFSKKLESPLVVEVKK